ncbi:MAG TPA: DUF1800 domain-containing protein, partial [Gemmatimonadaceae bacterium]
MRSKPGVCAMHQSSRIVVTAAIAALAACSSGRPARVEPAPAAMATPADIAAQSAPREQTADEQVNQVLNRLTFGARSGDIQAVRAMGVDAWIDRQLHPERINDSTSDRHFATLESYNTSSSALEKEYPPPNRKVTTEAQGGRIDRALLTERQLQEVMTDFWLNHFSVYIWKGRPERYQLAQYESKVIRPNALGKFHTLLEAVAKSPAMLFYLDNWESQVDSTRPRLMRVAARRRGGLNENYGRELLELHTLGVDGGYTQQDVINVARAFTGWTFPRPQQGGGAFEFNPRVHDAGEKIVLGYKLPAGRGIQDGEDVLDIVSREPATAHFIAFKLARRFVADTPPAGLVDRAAATFMRTDGDIREVVRTIVTSPEFFSHAAYRSKVKSPFEVVVSALRALGAQPDSTGRTARIIATLGEPIYGHQAPNGWPETGDQWMNSGAILARINFGMAIAAGKIPGV